MQPQDDILPLYTGVVRLKSYGKGEDVHVCRNRRSHLLVLTPDAIQLFTTSDAGMEEDLQPALAPKPSLKSVSMVTSGRANVSRMSLRHLLAHPRKDIAEEGETSNGNSPTATALASASHSSSSLLDDTDELAEGQVFRLGVALNQVVAVEIVKESRLKVFYQPNRPSKKGTVEEQTLMVLRGLLRTVDLMSSKWRESGSAAPPVAHPNAHHFTVIMDSQHEAAGLKEDIERTQRQLALAVVWLSEGLPLRSASSIVMVTIGPGSNSASSASHKTGGSGTGDDENNNLGNNNHGTSDFSTGGGQAYTIPYPSWNATLTLPNEVSSALASPTSRRALTTSVKVYLSTPLGPATAELPLLQLMQSAAEGSAPVTTASTLRDPPEVGASLRPDKRWDVLLQWRAEKGEVVAPFLVGIPGGTGSIENAKESGTGLHRGQQGPQSAKDSGREHQQRAREVAITRGVGGGAVSLLILLVCIYTRLFCYLL